MSAANKALATAAEVTIRPQWCLRMAVTATQVATEVAGIVTAAEVVTTPPMSGLNIGSCDRGQGYCGCGHGSQ